MTTKLLFSGTAEFTQLYCEGKMDDYSTAMELANDEGILGMMLGIFVVGFLFYLVISFCYGKIFQKAGKPLWAGFVPIYSTIILLEIVGRPLWWLAVLIGAALFSMIPFIGLLGSALILAWLIIVNIDLAKSFGKDVVWGILLTLLGPVMLAIMAFSSDIKYVGPWAKDRPGI